ncbi:telomerase inhibitor [Ascosphaera aggregata]|nr:telomerase inhibitor [Ascosphaera aggregata]
MGLAAPRKRTKIPLDPNNNNWARSTSNYGHRIMSRQGWAPGDTLGVKDSAHSRHFTSASYSHIRVSRKDDNLGLGARARRPLEDDEPTGLDAFQGLLGRLNGKSDAELHKEQRKREDRKLMSYVERRWKTMHFISGGFLVQEKPAVPHDSTKGDSDGASKLNEREEEKKEKKSKKSKKESNRDRKDQKQKKDRRKKESSSSPSGSGDDHDTDEEAPSALEDVNAVEKSYSRKHKDKTKKRKAAEIESVTKERETEMESKLSQGVSQSPAPVHLPLRQLKGRHVLRGRHIRSKRMATLDDKSLNEIFMVKAKA